MEDPILEIRGLRLTIQTDEGLAKVLDHIDFALDRGHILGIVGEFGMRQIDDHSRDHRHLAERGPGRGR